MRSFVDWIKDPGFIIKDTWDEERQMSAGPGKLVLQPIQERVLGLALTPDGDGLLPYTTILLGQTKKSGKTTQGAAIMAWAAEEWGVGTEIFSTASSKEQSVGRSFGDIGFHLKHTERNHSVRMVEDEYTWPSGSLIKALAKNYKTAAGSRHSLTHWDELWCVDPKTEMLTRAGWKHYDELEKGEIVASWKEGRFVWTPLKGIHQTHYNGPMLRLSHRRADMLLTPNHRVLGRFRSSGHSRLRDAEWEVRTASKSSKAYEGQVPSYAEEWKGSRPDYLQVPALTRRTHTKEQVFPERRFLAGPFMSLLGYYLSEGSIKYYEWKDVRVPAEVSIGQSKEANRDIYNNIEKVLVELGLEYRAHEWGFYIKDTHLACYLARYGKSAFSKRLHRKYMDLSRDLLERFFISYAEGDGHQLPGEWQIFTSSDEMKDALLEIGIKLGYTSRHMLTRENGNHRLSFSEGPVCYHRKNWSSEYYEGAVWCPQVDSGVWLARRGGNVFWTGNSFETERDKRMWDELTPIPTVKNSLQVITTYAGFEGESELLWNMYLKGVGTEEHKKGEGKKIPGYEDLPLWENGRQLTLWDHQNRMPWQTEEYINQQLENLRPSAFLRFHRNQWTTSDEAFIPKEWWDMAATHFEKSAWNWPEHPYKSFPVYMFIDAATKKDNIAIVGVCYDAATSSVVLLFHKIWEPAKADLFDFEEEIEPYVLEAARRFQVVAVHYDPRDLYQTSLRLAKKGINMVEYKQTPSNISDASQALYEVLKTGSLRAYPDEKARKQVIMTVAKNTERGFQITKRNQRGEEPNDFTVALACAVKVALDSGGVGDEQVIRIESPLSDFSEWGEGDLEPDHIPFPLRSNNT